MIQLIQHIKEFESRNNISIDVVVFGDASSVVREFWGEDEFKSCTSIKELFDFLRTAELMKSSDDGRCIKPIEIITNKPEKG